MKSGFCESSAMITSCLALSICFFTGLLVICTQHGGDDARKKGYLCGALAAVSFLGLFYQRKESIASIFIKAKNFLFSFKTDNSADKNETELSKSLTVQNNVESYGAV